MGGFTLLPPKQEGGAEPPNQPPKYTLVPPSATPAPSNKPQFSFVPPATPQEQAPAPAPDVASLFTPPAGQAPNTPTPESLPMRDRPLTIAQSAETGTGGAVKSGDWLTDAMLAPGTFLGRLLQPQPLRTYTPEDERRYGQQRLHQMDEKLVQDINLGFGPGTESPLFDASIGMEPGYMKGFVQALSSFTAPQQLPLMAAPESRLFTAAFAAATPLQLYAQYGQYKMLKAQGKDDEANAMLGNMTLNGALGTLAAFHAVRGEDQLAAALDGEVYGAYGKDAAALQQEILNQRSTLLSTLPPERQLALLQRYGVVPPDINLEAAMPSFARTKAGNLQIGADIGRLTEILGSSMYSNRGAPVVVKELLQNSLDAVRENGGFVHVNVDRSNRTFKIDDGGVGMLPQEVFSVFTDIGASGKANQAGASGGFGLAKIAPFMIPEKMEVTTKAFDPTTNKYKVTQFTSTPDSIINGKVTPISYETREAATGTSIKVTFPKDEPDKYDQYDFYNATEFLKRFLGSSAIPSKDFRVMGPYGSIEPEHAAVTPAFTLDGPGGKYVFSLSKERSAGKNYIEYEVHNNGLYQFTGSAYSLAGEKVPIADRIVINLQPNVKEGAIDYPFTTNRESVAKAAKTFIDTSIVQRLVNPELEGVRKTIKDKYNNLPLMEVSPGETTKAFMPIYDSGARLTPGELNRIQNSPAMKDIGAAILRVTTNLTSTISQIPASVFGGDIGRQMGSTINRVGLLLADTIEGNVKGGGQRTYGVYIPDPNTPGRASVFVNPFGWASLASEASEAATGSPKGLGPKWFYNPDTAASSILHTIMHEIVHDVIKGHNEGFTSAMGHMYSFLGMQGIQGMEDLANAFRDPNNFNAIRTDYGELLQVYRSSRGRPETEKDILGGESLATGGERPNKGPEAAPTPPAPERREEDIRADIESAWGRRPFEGGPGAGPHAATVGGETPEGNKLDHLMAILPSFADVMNRGEATPPPTVAGPDATAGIGAVDGRPPVISPVIDRDLANGGINVIRGGDDIGLVARYLGSLSQAARRLGNPIFKAAADKIIDTSIAIARNTRDSINGFHREVRTKVNPEEWDRVVDLLNNPDINTGNLPLNLPDNIRDAYGYTRGLLDEHRTRTIDAKRREMMAGGMSAQKATELVPDTWGIREGYYVHAFPGNWTVTEHAGFDARGNDIWQPIDTGWRSTTLSEAQAKAKDYLTNNPGSNLKVQLDNVSLPGRGITDRNRLRALHDEIRDASTFIHNGANPDGVMSDLRETAAKLNFGPRRPAPRVFGPTLEREANLPGWVRDQDNFERYIIGMERYIELAPARAEILKLRNSIAQMSGMPEVMKPGEIPKRYSGDYANTLGRLDASIEALEGYPTGLDAAIRNTLQKHGYDPNLVNNAYSTVNSIEALMKLGFNPASAGLHLAQTIAATYPVLGERWTAHGIYNAYAGRYDALVHSLGIEATSNLMDIDTFQAYRGGYLSGITGPITAAKAGFKALQDTGLFMFSKGVETARRVAAIGAYEKGLHQGMTEDQARDYARDVLVRTQFLYSPADTPIALRTIPRPMTQFKNFTFKMAEYVTGLRGAEIPRFMTAMGIIGFAGLPALSALSSVVRDVFNYDPENELKRAFPRFSRGALGYLGIDYTRNIGFADWLVGRGPAVSQLLGPAGSDILNAVKGAVAEMKGPSREGQVDIDNALRNISPEARRLWDEANRLAGTPSLIDPRTGSTIIKNLTPKEQVETTLGFTPLRVAEEREAHEYIREQLAQYKDKKGWFLDRLAELQVALSDPRLSESQRMDIVKQTTFLAKESLDYGVPVLPRSVIERAREMQMERLQRDIKKAPRPERFLMWKEQQRFLQENPQPQP